MPRRVLLWTSAGLALLTLACVAALDAPVARLVAHRSDGWEGAVRALTSVLETVALFPLSKFALSLLVLLAGAVLWRRHRAAAVALVYVGATAFATRLGAGMLKNVFGRERPFEVAPAFEADFFAGGSAFPSGHAAHFWGLYFPLAFLFPRYRWAMLPVPVFVSVLRVGVNDHFAGDVVASAALGAFVAWAFAWRLRGPEPATSLR